MLLNHWCQIIFGYWGKRQDGDPLLLSAGKMPDWDTCLGISGWEIGIADQDPTAKK